MTTNIIFSCLNLNLDKQGILEMSLNTAENILNASGEELKIQLCQNRPLTVLGTVLTSSLKLNEVFIIHSRY